MWHEQQRPDRDNYVDIDADKLQDSNYKIMDAQTWFDTGHPYDVESIMHYGGIKFHNGEVYAGGDVMTTTDSLQFEDMYCKEMPQYRAKPAVTCQSTDHFGFTRPLYTDRLCDGYSDCPNGEDEDGTIAPCDPNGGLLTTGTA